jgi:hypothetical protein
MDKCEKCLYKENCQFLATHKRTIIEGCTAFKSEAELRAEMVREIFEEIEELFRQHKEGGYYLNGAWFPERLDLYTEDAFEELKKKYAKGKDEEF